MLANTSSSNDSHPGPQLPVMSYSQCLFTRPSSFIYTAFIGLNVVLFLPLFIFILYYGFKQWWRNRSKSSSSAVNNSDCFTYHMVAMEIVGVTGCVISFGGLYGGEISAVKVGTVLFSFTWYGEGFFQNLTCVEHFLAVLYPIAYLRLKNKVGIRIRNVTIGCVWLLCFVGLGLAAKDNYIIMDSCIIILTVTVTPYCCLSVLWALNHQGTWRESVDQSKQRAFYTVVAILGVLILSFFYANEPDLNRTLRNREEAELLVSSRAAVHPGDRKGAAELCKMLMNFSSAQNESAPPLSHLFSSEYLICLSSRPTSTVFFLFVIIYVCLHLPLSVFILHHGLLHWKKHLSSSSSSSSSSWSVSHCDCFTYHLAGVELIGITGYILTCFAICMKEFPKVLRSGTLLYSFSWFGEMCFHMFTCTERYLAVVHPIVYLKLRNRRWIRTRNVVAAVVWVLGFLWPTGSPRRA